MSEKIIKIKISKKDFEMKLLKKFKNKLSKAIIKEEYDEYKYHNVTCYYVNDKHIATWCEGKGWEF